METIFAVPMRNNNNNLRESGDQLLDDWVTWGTFHKLQARFVVETIDVDGEIIVTYILRNGATILFESNSYITEVGDFQFGFMHGATDVTTIINATVQTVGQARFSINVSAFERGEDYL